MGDLIDRDEAISALVTIDTTRYCVPCREVLMAIKNMPSAEPTFDARDTQYNLPIGTDTISRQAAIDALGERPMVWTDNDNYSLGQRNQYDFDRLALELVPSAEPQKRKTGKWIQDRSGAYCCSKCMEPCATYVMMKPRDKFCKMCGARMEVME